ncbi:zonular occludens toxin domain-containing protein [Sulfurimonas sp.]
MIELITGVPGSGKSYFAAKKIKEIYDSKKRLIYTNVNLRVSYDDYLKPLDVVDLFAFAKSEYKLFDKFTKLSEDYKKRHDEILLLDDSVSDEVDPFSKYYGNYDDYLKDSGLLSEYGGCFISWDECQNDLALDDPLHEIEHKNKSALKIWVRFFSYHRHFNIDIQLVTQDVSLVHRRIKSFISRYYFGQNAAKRFFSNTLKFKVYTDSKEFEKYYIETLNIKMEKEIHNFYDSGEYTPDSSLFLKKLLPAFLLIFSIGFGVYFFIHSKEDVPIPLHKTSPGQTSPGQTSPGEFESDENINEGSHIVFFMCNLNDCNLLNSSFVVPLDSMNDFADYTDSKILFSSHINQYYSRVAVVVNDSLYNDLMKYNLTKRGDKHENNKINFNSPISKF